MSEPQEPAPASTTRERDRELDDLATVLIERRAKLDAILAARDEARSRAQALRARRTVRVLTAGGDRFYRTRARVRGTGRWAAMYRRVHGVGPLGRLLPAPGGEHRLRASVAAEQALRKSAASLVADERLGDGVRLIAIVRSAGDASHGADVVRGVREDWGDAVVVVIRPGDHPEAGPAVGSHPVRGDDGTIHLAGGSFADALRAAEAVQRGGHSGEDVVLFVHDDVTAAAPGTLARLVGTLTASPAVAAVSGQLVLARRDGPWTGPLEEAPDLTIGEAGVSMEICHGDVVARRLGRGSTPRLTGAPGLRPVPAASAACLAVRRGALDPTRGYLDVDEDLAPALDVRAGGGRIVVDDAAIFLHAERSDPPALGGKPPWAHKLARSVGLDRLAGAGEWSADPFHLGITVTEDDPGAGFGDWYTAHELGDALSRLGWRISYLERKEDRWYEPPEDLDAVLVLIDLFDLTLLPPGIIRIAWARNWVDQWIERPWFDDYDLVLTTSRAAKEVVERRTASLPTVFPIATNPERFSPGEADPALASDVAFVGSYFGRDRDIVPALAAVDRQGLRPALWGVGWDDVPEIARLARGPLDYERVPAAYRSTRVVVDDTNEGSTRDLGMVNSRVFDALATGVPVITNNLAGARELFGDDFPTYADPDDLTAQVARLVENPAAADDLARRFQAVVLEQHTYDRRAQQLRSLVGDWLRAERWAIAIGPLTRAAGTSWGDTYYARALQRQLARKGRPTRVHVHNEWTAAEGRADVALHLYGARAPRPRPGPVTLLWVISHPDRITGESCTGYDHVFVASDRFAARLQSETGVPVTSLHQATDPDRFHPVVDAAHVSEVLFVGSSRGQRRPMVDAAVASRRDLAVFGTGWTSELIDLSVVRGEWIPNDALAQWYSGAAIVLADHYDDMRDLGFISNRIYDALACGTFVLSDDVTGLAEEFDGGAVACRTEADAVAAIVHYLGDPTSRQERAERGRRAVLERHTFDRRADELIKIVAPRLAGRIGTVDPAAPDEPAAVR